MTETGTATKHEIQVHDHAPEPATGAGTETGMLLSVIKSVAFNPDVDPDKVERFLQMHERVVEREAKMAFDEAMKNAQAAMTAVRADANNPQTRSKYASYAALDRAVRPIYTDHGFSLSFNTGHDAPADHVRVLCEVAHSAGFTKHYHVDMPADGKGAKGGDVMTKTHAAGSAMSYGQRYLLKLIFNLAVSTDDDGNAADGPVRLTAAQAKEWIRHDHITSLIRECPTFRRLANMRERIAFYTFLPPEWVRQWEEECDKRAEELDAKLSDRAKGKTTPEPADDGKDYQSVLSDVEGQLTSLDPLTLEGIDEVEREYKPRLKGANEDIFLAFRDMIEGARDAVPNMGI